jgi:hypothetical protein
MPYYFTLCFVCLVAACGDPDVSASGGSSGTGGASPRPFPGTGGAPPAPPTSELRDFSDFTSFRFSQAGPEEACAAEDKTTYVEILRREDGGFDFDYSYLEVDEECESPLQFRECYVNERGDPRPLSSDEARRVEALFSEFLLVDAPVDHEADPGCAADTGDGEVCEAFFRWDEESLSDSPCDRLRVSGPASLAAKLMFDVLRLSE